MSFRRRATIIFATSRATRFIPRCQFAARSVDPRFAALRRRTDADGKRPLSLERIGRRSYLCDAICRRRPKEKCTLSGPSRKIPRRATSARSTPTRTGQGGLHINSTRSARPMETFAVTLENRRHNHRPHRPDGAGIKTILRTQAATAGHPYRGAACSRPYISLCSLRSLWPIFLSFSESFSDVESRLRRRPHRRSEIPASRRTRSPALARADRLFARPASLPSQRPAGAIFSPRLYAR